MAGRGRPATAEGGSPAGSLWSCLGLVRRASELFRRWHDNHVLGKRDPLPVSANVSRRIPGDRRKCLAFLRAAFGVSGNHDAGIAIDYDGLVGQGLRFRRISGETRFSTAGGLVRGHYLESRQPYYFVLFGVLLAAMSLRVIAWRRGPLVARTAA